MAVADPCIGLKTARVKEEEEEKKNRTIESRVQADPIDAVKEITDKTPRFGISCAVSRTKKEEQQEETEDMIEKRKDGGIIGWRDGNLSLEMEKKTFRPRPIRRKKKQDWRCP
jgi:hypothetical protein